MLDGRLRHRDVNPLLTREVVRDERRLIGRMNRHHQIRPSELGQVVGAAQRRDEQGGGIPALAVERVGALGDGETGLTNVRFLDRQPAVVRDFSEVVVEPADHEDRKTPPRREVVSPGPHAAAAMALGNRERLGDREAHRGGDGDALGHAGLEHVQTGGGRRQLDGDVWRPRVKPPGHRQHLVAIAGTRRVDLRTDEAVLAAASFKRRQEPAGGARHRDLDARFGQLRPQTADRARRTYARQPRPTARASWPPRRGPDSS